MKRRAARVRRAALGLLAALAMPLHALPLHAQGSATRATSTASATPATSVTPRDDAARAPGRIAGRVERAVRSLDRAAAQRERVRATEKYDPIFRKYTKRYFGIATDWRWFKAQGMAESDLTPTARSRVGARGIMQLMPSTYAQIQSKQLPFRPIDDPEWNIAAGIAHDRYLWTLWEKRVQEPDDRWDFMFGSYNAGQGTIYRAQRVADSLRLDRARWANIERVAPTVQRWRYTETLGYVKKIRANRETLPAR